jgi:dTMP kinase
VTEQQQPQAPFIPASPDEQPEPPAALAVFKVPGFTKFWLAQVIASTGDWVGFVAILTIARRVSESGTTSGAAVGLVMIARMLPGFVLAPVGGALVDRWDRKTVMVWSNIGRAFVLAALPFFDSLWGLVFISFVLEVLALLWAPAKDATTPNIVTDRNLLAPANSLSLAATYGTFLLATLMFSALAGIAAWLSEIDALSLFDVNQASLAIWVNSLTFLVSAVLISRLRLSRIQRDRAERPDLTQTYRDIVDGLRFIRSHPLVRGVMIGLAGGLLGGGAIIPLGAIFSQVVLGRGDAGFSLLLTAFGIGVALGIATVLVAQSRIRLPRELIFVSAVIACGISIMIVACVSDLSAAMVIVGVVGATAGSAYVVGFTLLQESVADEMRGRTFATLYTIVRLCLLLSLTIGPFVAALLGAISDDAIGGDLDFGTVHVSLPGVRLALWLGGIVTVLAGLMARRRMRMATRVETGAA